MTELYVIRIRYLEKSQDGYLGDQTDLSDDKFSVRFLQPHELHSHWMEVVAFFSRRKAEELRDEIMIKIQRKSPSAIVTGDVEEHTFLNEEVQKVMNKGYVFVPESQRDGDD